MQVSVENISTLGRRLVVSVPAGELNTMIKDQMSTLATQAKVPGFRPGKVPKQILEQRYGQEVRQKAIGKVIEQSLPKALQDNDLKPAGRPVVEKVDNITDQDLRYTVSFEVFPKITLTDFSTITVEKYTVSVNEKDIDKTIVQLQEQLADWVVVDRPAKEGDKLIVDYTSTLQGKPYENSTGKDISVELGSKMFIDGFEQGLIEAKAGDKCELKLHFPKEWRLENLAGKPVEFTVHVKAVTEKHLAELNESFAKKVGAETAETKTLRTKIKENLEKQLEEIKLNRLKDQVTNALLKMNPISIPQALVEREASILHEEMHRRLGNQAEASCHHPGLLEQAEKRVALGLILNEVIGQEKLIADERAVENKIAALAKMFGNAEFIESMYYESEELLNQVRHTVLLDEALELVLSRCTQVEKHVTMDELFNDSGENKS